MTGTDIPRRTFLKAAPVAAYALAGGAGAARGAAPPGDASRVRLEPFDYRGVRLLASRWQAQFQGARDYYYGVPDADILHGFRAAAGLPAPGQPLGGWCRTDSATVFGQWLSGMARIARATGDAALRDKAVRLVDEFARTVGTDGDCRMRHYPFDKLVGGLVDMQAYAENASAVPLLEKVTGWASRTFSRDNEPAIPRKTYQGRPSEWYTLSENLYRAYQLTGSSAFRTFADAWLYHQYWDKFAATAAPPDAHGVHAYSHVNTFSSAAMAYAVGGDESYLRVIRNAWDFLQNTQCYATGGYGPRETIMPEGGLGQALEIRYDCFETVCGSWAGFKLSRYLMQFTGEARYGDWIERLVYNGVGAALPITAGGRNFYYADYRLAGGSKAYNWEPYTCCSGTYIQDVAAYHDLIYFSDRTGLYVNLYLPSEVVWKHADGEVRLTQETAYPEDEAIRLTLGMPRVLEFALRFRVPAWAREVSVKVNGTVAGLQCTPGTWASIHRAWAPGDRVEIRIPLHFRTQAVDRQHPHRIAVVRGPVVLVLEADYHESAFRLPESDADLDKWLLPEKVAGTFRVEVPGGGRVRSRFVPFYSTVENFSYKMYFDRNELPIVFG
jgi:DUF1680 family protein